ncbi:hypothetical protein [Runella sp.]
MGKKIGKSFFADAGLCVYSISMLIDIFVPRNPSERKVFNR